MGRRGPKNIYERTAINANRAAARTDARPPPTHLSHEAKLWWSDVVARFGIGSHRYQTLQAACEAWDLSQLARRTLAKGLSYKDAKGQWRARPEVAIARDARTAYLRAVKELRIDTSPASSPVTTPAQKNRLKPPALFPEQYPELYGNGRVPSHEKYK
jgi:phage terminase small subunit